MNNNIKNKKNKYLTKDDRVYIEGYLSKALNGILLIVGSKDKKYKISQKKRLVKIRKELAEKLQKSERTIKREIERGKYIKRDYLYREVYSYSYDLGQKYRNENKSKKEFKLKIGDNYKYYEYIGKLLKEKNSPYAALVKASKKEFDVNISLKTLYNYINIGLFESMDISIEKMPYKRKKYKGKLAVKGIKKTGRLSIENRSDKINNREEFGHWEIDCVVGTREGKSTSLLVLTERVSRYEIIRKIDAKRAEYVEEVLFNILNDNRYIIKSITSDNGSEFVGIKDYRTDIIDWFFAHPFCSGERGSNENNNKLIRRHIKKGKSMVNISENKIKKIERFMNNYPRKIFNGKTSKEIYEINMKKERNIE